MNRPATPSLTVDAIIELTDYPDRPIVLIRRAYPPLGWALPGGFVDVGESMEQAAIRESREETGLEIKLIALLGCYSDPARDPRGHTASVIYVARANGDPVGGDDAAQAEAFAPDGLPTPIVFDHASILRDYRHWRATGELPSPK